MLLGYLVFFLNLGPSFHRAPIFGLHDHSDQVTEFKCSCGHVHQPDETEQSEQEHHDDSVEKQLCDCSLCKFFKQYSAAVDVDEKLNSDRKVDQRVEMADLVDSRILLHNFARGPPHA